jgi:hypothetical protein
VPCVPGILQSKNPKKLPIFKTAVFVKKGWAIPHEKCPFLQDMDFLGKKITNLVSNFT